MEVENQEYENLIKNGKGRPSKTMIATDEKYWVNYYHMKNEDVLCECGATVSKFCLTKHKKRARHVRALELKAKLNC